MILEPLYENVSSTNNGDGYGGGYGGGHGGGLCGDDGDGVISLRVLGDRDFAGISVSDGVRKEAIAGSKFFKDRSDKGILFPPTSCSLAEAGLDDELEVHDYTGKCPVQTFEVNPVKGCNVGCAYCLVNDGVHDEAFVYSNYHELLKRRLAEKAQEDHYYYFSPKTEALCEATLQTGIAHKVLRTFIEHFEKCPDSGARLFIASKAGAQALLYRHEGDSVLDLFERLKGRMQFNTSLSIFPEGALELLEPYSACIGSRLEAVRLCRESGIMADSALVQPILIGLLSDELLEDFFALIGRSGIVNFKPEFLTVCVENMTLIAQILERYDRGILGKLFGTYFADENLDHRKQRGRTAPLRDESKFWIGRMREISENHNISMSICNWVRDQLGIGEEDLPLVNRNGFMCLGYQTRLFGEVNDA